MVSTLLQTVRCAACAQPRLHDHCHTPANEAISQWGIIVSARTHLNVVIHVGHVLDLLQPFVPANFCGPFARVSLLSVDAGFHISSLATRATVTPNVQRQILVEQREPNVHPNYAYTNGAPATDLV